MKRRWRSGRVILAGLLISLAALVFYVWPVGPRWKIEGEHPLGFDLKQNLLFTGMDTTQEGDGAYQLRGYDLVTGERRLEKSVMVERPNSDFRHGWRSILSADCSTLACFDEVASIQVFDVRDQCQRLCTIETNTLFSVTLSANGETLALQKGMEEIEVWNSRTGTIKMKLHMPAETVIRWFGGFACSPDNMQMSSDGHFLAVGTAMADVALFDLISGQAIGHITQSQLPQFLPNNKVLMSTPRYYQTGKAQWHLIESNSIKPIPFSHPMDFEFQGLAAAPELHLTFRWDRATSRTLPKWIPTSIRDSIEAALGWKKTTYFVTPIETSTGRVHDDFIFRVQMMHPAIDFDIVRLSPDGLLLAFMEDRELGLWDVPPRRSLTCWLLGSGIGVLALWLAWPRKVEQTQIIKSGAA